MTINLTFHKNKKTAEPLMYQGGQLILFIFVTTGKCD